MSQAIGFGAVVSAMTPVTAATRLPVDTAALSSTQAGTAVTGPFMPELGRAIVLALSGDWAGSVQMLRSTDGGATQLPLTLGGSAWAAYTGNVSKPVWEENDAPATFYLSIAVTSGTLSYQVS